MPTMHRHGPEVHRSNRTGWLRAAVLGADDGIVSTASLIVGVAGSGAAAATVRTAGIAGLVAGALSMAAGEYVSVAAQRDAERADLARERIELQEHPVSELAELAEIWRNRGLDPEVADVVARQLTAADALGAHARDELGLHEVSTARPLQAALASAVSFAVGALLPLLAFVAWTGSGRSAVVIVVATAALAASGAAGAVLGGAPWWRALVRVAAGGLVAMLVTLGIGEATGAALG
jgi:VIT1/CCC1 family predicted Fe2+/Mn2+ transporter